MCARARLWPWCRHGELIAPEFSSGRSYYTWLLSRPGHGDAEAGDRASIEAWEETLHLVSREKYLLLCKNICCCLQVRSQQRPGPHIKSQDTFSKLSWRRKYEEIETVL